MPSASAGEAPTTETPTSEMPTTTAAPTEAPSTLGFDADNEAASSEYCEIARRLDENEAPFSIYDDPETLQTYVTGVMEDIVSSISGHGCGMRPLSVDMVLWVWLAGSEAPAVAGRRTRPRTRMG